MSNVILESAASGRPVITTNRSGCREIVEDGVTGYLFEQRNTEELIDKIETFLSLKPYEREKMGIMGRKKVECEFNREIVISAYVQQIENILNADV